MSWRLVDESTTVAPRNLTRATARGSWSKWGYWKHPEPASVGGTVSTTHYTFKHDCGALAPPRTTEGKCGKCGRS